MRKTIELDYTGYDDEDHHVSMGDEAGRPLVEASVARYLLEYAPEDAVANVRIVFGPGGGAAVVDWTMEEADLRPFLLTYTGQDAETTDWLLEMAEPAA